MIGVFAKMFGPNDRVAEVKPIEGRDGYEVTATGPGVEASVVGDDEPPAAFSEKVAYDGGTVYVIPFMEAFRAWVQRTKRDAAGEADAEGQGADVREAEA